ncbi:MAG: hypothetical protein HKM04_06480 [Legionellales bacterium]|nr:hypothetical protein [Legionellales bacterium]
MLHFLRAEKKSSKKADKKETQHQARVETLQKNAQKNVGVAHQSFSDLRHEIAAREHEICLYKTKRSGVYATAAHAPFIAAAIGLAVGGPVLALVCFATTAFISGLLAFGAKKKLTTEKLPETPAADVPQPADITKKHPKEAEKSLSSRSAYSLFNQKVKEYSPPEKAENSDVKKLEPPKLK